MTLELRGVGKEVAGQVWVHPTDLTLTPASMNVLLGPTTAGKTTLMRLMAGLDQPSQGRILWNGTDVTGQRVQDRKVAMVYQQFINYPSMSVYDNIASPLRLQGVARPEIDRRVRETAEMMRLTPMLARRPLELSGGQQQRTALARALVKGAGLVLLDEPLANLDYKLREELRAEIPRIFAESGAIFVYATTEPEEALLLGGNTATLWEGRVTQFGPTPQVYRAPVDAITARVFSDPPMNFAEVSVAGGRYVFAQPGVDASVAQAVLQKRQQDDMQVAALVAKGTPAIKLIYDDGDAHSSFKKTLMAAGSDSLNRTAAWGSRDVGVSRPDAITSGPRVVVLPAVLELFAPTHLDRLSSGDENGAAA